jgi:hypothetical protein
MLIEFLNEEGKGLRRIITPSFLALLIFLVFSVFFTFFCGPIGYTGDSWNSIYAGTYTKDFFHPQPMSRTNLYLRHRPVLYAFDVYLLQKWVGLWGHPTAHHFVLLLFLSLSVFLFGKLLERIYPDEPLFIVITLLLIFFYGPVFISSFIRHNIIAFVATIFFWSVGLCLFHLARTRSLFSFLLYVALALVCYLLSVFSFELFILSIWVFPVWVYWGKIWPPLMRLPQKSKHIILRTVLPVAGMFATLLGIKYFIIRYLGRSTNFSILHYFQLIWKYVLTLWIAEIAVMKDVMVTNYRYLALLLLVSLLFLTRNLKFSSKISSYFPAFLIGILLAVCGSAPFIIIGHDVSLNLSITYWRGIGFFDTASYGFILMLSGLLLLKKKTRVHQVFRVLILFLLSCHIAFAFLLAGTYHEAARMQKSLFTSLLEVCPDVEDETAFIFLLPLSFETKAPVFRGEDATYVLPQIIYHNQTLQGRIIYTENVTNTGRIPIITQDRIRPVPKGVVYNVPLEKILIIKGTPHATFEITELRQTDPLNAIWAESCFELTKDNLYGMMNEGLPDEIKEHLKSLKNRVFFKDEFLEAIEEHIGKEETEKYQELILKYAWRWTETYFELTEQNMQNLREKGVPEIILSYLIRVEHRAFPREQEFLEAVADYIGKEQTAMYRELLIQYARKKVDSITEVKSNTSLIKQKRVSNAFTKYLESLPD